jgi:hypothetical protein
MDGMNDNVKVVLCHVCGYENKASNSFCLQCGEMIEQVAPEEPPQTTGYEASENPYNPYYPEANQAGGGEAPQVYSLRDYANVAEQPIPAPVAGNSGLAIASMVCGIVSMVCCCLMPFTSIASLVCGIIALVTKQNGKGMAIAGVVLAAAAMVIYTALFIIYVLYVDSLPYMEGVDDIYRRL